MSTPQPNAKDKKLFQFKSPFSYPVEVLKPDGSFFPTDKKTGVRSKDELFKYKSEIYDPNKVHPIRYRLYMPEEKKLPKGKYLAQITLAYLENDGAYKARLEYTKTDDKTFKETIDKNKKEGIKLWDTKLDVEIHGNEVQGTGFAHEAYIYDTHEDAFILISCWQREPLKEGKYKLEIKLEYQKGKLVPRSIYHFVSVHK